MPESPHASHAHVSSTTSTAVTNATPRIEAACRRDRVTGTLNRTCPGTTANPKPDNQPTLARANTSASNGLRANSSRKTRSINTTTDFIHTERISNATRCRYDRTRPTPTHLQHRSDNPNRTTSPLSGVEQSVVPSR
jgi:hypothetical protein